MASGQLLAELGSGGEVGRQLLLDAQGLVVVLLRLLGAGPWHPAEGPGCCGFWPAPGGTRVGRGSRPPVASGCSGPGRSPAPPPGAGPCHAADCPGCCGFGPAPGGTRVGRGSRPPVASRCSGPGRSPAPPPWAGPWPPAEGPGCCGWWPAPGGTRVGRGSRPPVASGCSGPGRSPAPPPEAGPCPTAEGPGCCESSASSSAELGSGGEVGRQLLVDAQGLVVVLLRLLEFTQRATHVADPHIVPPPAPLGCRRRLP